LFGYTGRVDGVQTLYTEIGARMCQLVTKASPALLLDTHCFGNDSSPKRFFFKLLVRALLAKMRKPLEQLVADYSCSGAYDIDKIFDDINQQMKERKIL
jgi:hypothetical protein